MCSGTLYGVLGRCTFALTDIIEAHRHLETGIQIGKTVATITFRSLTS
jgi:hypothetical protein